MSPHKSFMDHTSHKATQTWAQSYLAEEREPCMLDRAEGRGREVGRPKGPAGCTHGCRLLGQNQQVAAGSEFRWTPWSRVGLFK